MATDPNAPTQTADALTPSATRDTTNHQQVRPNVTENRANADAPDEGRDADGMPGERVVGQAAGPDTSGAVAPPAAGNMPGSSAELDGVPGALATDGKGRQGG